MSPYSQEPVFIPILGLCFDTNKLGDAGVLGCGLLVVGSVVVFVVCVGATWEKGSPGCSLLCLVTLLLPFINS